MIHNMGLFEAPFSSIKSGRKTIEVRLYDQKRRKVKVGDFIKFYKLPDEQESLTVKVHEINVFSTFKEMYESLPASCFDTDDSSIEERVKRIRQIYSASKEKEWGTVAFTIEVC